MIEDLQHLVREEQAFPIEAYLFLYQALDRSQRLVGSRRHVTGQELLEGIRLLAIDQFGPLTLMVFEHWGVTRSEDFGVMVFHLVDRGLMGKTDEDKLEDFSAVYDFEEAFQPDRILAGTDLGALAGGSWGNTGFKDVRADTPRVSQG